MQGFDQNFMRTLRLLYDIESQLVASLAAVSQSGIIDDELAKTLDVIALQSADQARRLEDISRILYQDARGEAAWAATALLRSAIEAASGESDAASATEACAVALLSLKRYELTLYEALLHWSERYDLDEALPAIRRTMAEELLQASVLAGFAFRPDRTRTATAGQAAAIVH